VGHHMTNRRGRPGTVGWRLVTSEKNGYQMPKQVVVYFLGCTGYSLYICFGSSAPNSGLSSLFTFGLSEYEWSYNWLSHMPPVYRTIHTAEMACRIDRSHRKCDSFRQRHFV